MKGIAILIITVVIVTFASFVWAASPTNSNTAQGVDLAKLDGWARNPNIGIDTTHGGKPGQILYSIENEV